MLKSRNTLSYSLNPYPFGMVMPDRSGAYSGTYRFGFNGKEKDDEWKSNGNSYDFGARIYDPRLGRWMSPDGIVKPELSTYQFGKNNPIFYIDKDGDDEWAYNVNTGELSLVSNAGGKNTQYVSFIKVVDDNSAVQLLATGQVNGKNVYVTDIGGVQPKFVLSNYDLQLAPNYNLYSYKDYEYGATDLEKRRKLMLDGSVLWTAIQKSEREGTADPITGQGYDALYGTTTGRLIAFANFSSMMFELAEIGGHLDDAMQAGATAKEIRNLKGRLRQAKRNARSAFGRLQKESPSASGKGGKAGQGSSVNPWNAWLKRNKGTESGKGAMKRYAKRYKAEKGGG